MSVQTAFKVLIIPNRLTGQNSFHLENKDDDFGVVTNVLFKNDTANIVITYRRRAVAAKFSTRFTPYVLHNFTLPFYFR